MLKYIRGLIFVTTLILANVYVSPTYAASADIMITHIQAGGAGAALEELVFIYNNSYGEVDITEWCVTNKSNIRFACFLPDNSAQAIILPARSAATIASTALLPAVGFSDFSLIYTPTNQSSGSIVGGGDTISLINQRGDVVDKHNWTTGITGGLIFNRLYNLFETIEYIDSDHTFDWFTTTLEFIPTSNIERRIVEPDLCPNIVGRQTEIPEGMQIDEVTHSCAEQVHIPEQPMLLITELLPDAIDSDVGQEFIELYNPAETSLDLSNYVLWFGPALDKSVGFPEGSIIPGLSYATFTNANMAFSLLNTASEVQVRTAEGDIVTDSLGYQDPVEGKSWSLIDEVWQYTYPTPGAQNVLGAGIPEPSKEVASSLQSCAANQYRSPETNRCRLASTSNSTVTPCKDNQYRSEETNRCRNIASTSDVPAPCKEGQERNPETNRCRTVVAMTKADYAVLGTETKGKSNVYVWFAVAGVLLLAIAYSIWEWRFEIHKIIKRIAKVVRRRK